MLSEFSHKQDIPYPLLSDIDSEVIRLYGILNDQVKPGDAPIYGIPYPGVWVCNEDGVVVSKFFHDSYKKRDSPEALIDAALGRIVLDQADPVAQGGTDDVRVTAVIRGGKGSIRQGIIRQVLIRFELADGLHIYGEPVSEGMVPATVTVEGPPGLVVGNPILPPTEPLYLEDMNLSLHVWSGTVDFVVPFYPVGELASEVRPLDADKATIEVKVRYQACDSNTCLLPKTQHFLLDLPMDVIDIPNISIHQGHGQREANFDGTRHMRRLMERKLKNHRLGFIRFRIKRYFLDRAAKRRQKAHERRQSSARTVERKQ